MFIRLNKRAQSTAEYAILIAIVVGAVVAMQVYVRRGLQGRVKDIVDNTGSDTITEGNVSVANPFSGSQYEPYYASSAASSSNDTNATETVAQGGSVNRTLNNETSKMNREQTIGWEGEDLKAKPVQ